MIKMIPDSLTTFDIVGIIVGCIFFCAYFGQKLRKGSPTEKLETILCAVLFGFIYCNGILFLNVVRFRQDPYADMISWLLFTPYIILPILILVCTGLSRVFKGLNWLNRHRDQYLQRIYELRDHPTQTMRARADLLRKLMHIAFFCLVLILSLVAAYLTRIIEPWSLALFQQIFWEIQPDFYYLLVWQQPDMVGWIGRLHLALAGMCHVGTIVAMWLDLIRFSDKFWMIGRNSILHFCRPSELTKLPSFVPFFIGIGCCAIVLPPLPVFAIMFVMIFADTFASQIGIRLGKHKIGFNNRKSWEGTISGTLIAIFSVIFVGWLWGLVAVVVFLGIDLLTDRFIPLSDNLLTPLFIGICFFLLSFYAIPYNSLSFFFF